MSIQQPKESALHDDTVHARVFGSPTSSRLSANERLDQDIPTNPQRSIAMFSGIDQVHIGVGNFSLYNINNRDDNMMRHVAFQFLPRSYDAAFSAAINLDYLARRPCTDGTRVAIIAQIMAWVNERNPTKALPVYWLTGLAGLGKTTIAYTICKLLDQARLPFASFFCSLQLDSRNPKLLVTTLCRDLAELYPSYAAKVLSTLETNSKAVHAGLRTQIDELLAKPWQASITQQTDSNTPTPIVVVDALDESDGGTEFLEELLRVIHAGQLAGIKFLVTSRPEPKIANICKSFPPNAVCKLHEVDTANVQNDIEKYLQEALPKLKDEPELALLSQRAGGFFIYATTAVRFISPPHSPPAVSEMRSHLRAILNAELFASHAESDDRLLVDELYERILGDAFRDAKVRATRLRILHTIVCAESGIKVSVLADLTDTDSDIVERVVESLHAVLFISPKDGCVYWYHASFPDFVFSEVRAKIMISLRRNYPTHHVIDVSCNSSVHHGVLARRCISVMRESLQFNMCDLPSSYVFDSAVSGLKASIDKAFTPTLRYVSRFWARHLLQAAPAKNDSDDLVYGVEDLLHNKLLFWIEAMNLIGAKSECPSLLQDAETWLKRGMRRPDIFRQLTDAINFSSFFAGSLASKSTPHLYISAFSMWNQDSTIWKNWSDRFEFIPTISLSKGAITIPLLTVRTTDKVTCIAFSPDGGRMVSGSKDTSMWVWDARTGEQLIELQGHSGVNSVSFSPDGDRIVSGSKGASVRVWDAKTGKQSRELRAHTDYVSSVAFSPDGSRIVSGSWDKSMRVWDARTGKQFGELQGHTNCNSVAFSPDGNRIVSGFRNESVCVWDAKTGRQLRQLQGHTACVSSVAFSPDGSRIVSGSWDKSVRLWDARTGQQLRQLQGHMNWVTSVAFSPDGSRIASGSWDKSVRLWDAKTGQQLGQLQGHTDYVTSVAFSLDGNRIVSGSEDQSLRVWDAWMGKQFRELQGHIGVVPSVAFSPDGNRIVSCSEDKSVRVLDARTGKQLRESQAHTDYVSSVAFSPDGGRIASGSWDKACVWDARTGNQLRELQGHTDWVNSVAFSPDGNLIVSGSRDESVRLWDARTGQQLRQLQGHMSCVTSVAFSPDDNRIVSGSRDKSVRVWDARTGKQLRELQGHMDWVTSATFSPDGNRIVSGSHDKSVQVWDARMGKQLRELQGHMDWVTSVAFSPDGNRIVSGSEDKSVRVWDARTGQQLKQLQGHMSCVTSVAFSPDDNRIVSGSRDKSVRVWDARTGQQLRQLQGHTNRVTSVAFSPDGNRIVSGSGDKSVRIWDNLNRSPSWIVNDDGWILSGADLLAWVPSTICNIMLSPHNPLIISPNGSAEFSFGQSKLGTLWHECYTPGPS